MIPHRLTPAERKAKRHGDSKGHLRGRRIPESRNGEMMVGVTRLGLSRSRDSHPVFVTRGYYEDQPFTCRDCGKEEVWTASQQKWWFEVAKGEQLTVASRCRKCRRRERERREAARRVHADGLTRKYGWAALGISMAPGVQIENLRDRPEFIPMVATCHHLEWGHLRPGDTVEARVARLESMCRSNKEPPAFFIAISRGLFVGSAMLLPHDIDDRPELTPWLGGVFTVPRFRRRGIASALCSQVMRHAAQLGFRRLFLYTFGSTRFSERLGWTTTEHSSHLGREVTVMVHELAPAK